MILDSKLSERVLEKIKEQDEAAQRMLLEGFLPDYPAVREWIGRRKALADCKTIITETLEDLMKE